jgi:hypothetical protein
VAKPRYLKILGLKAAHCHIMILCANPIAVFQNTFRLAKKPLTSYYRHVFPYLKFSQGNICLCNNPFYQSLRREFCHSRLYIYPGKEKKCFENSLFSYLQYGIIHSLNFFLTPLTYYRCLDIFFK